MRRGRQHEFLLCEMKANQKKIIYIKLMDGIIWDYRFPPNPADMIQIKIDKSFITSYAHTIVSWFRWIWSNVGIVQVERDGSIRIASQMKLD